VEPPRAPESDNSYSNDPNGIDLAAGRRSGARTFRVPALVLAGAAVIGSIFWLERIEPRLPEAAPFVATAEGPTIVQPRSNFDRRDIKRRRGDPAERHHAAGRGLPVPKSGQST
jgi:hypothetical protein